MHRQFLKMTNAKKKKKKKVDGDIPEVRIDFVGKQPSLLCFLTIMTTSGDGKI